MNLREQLIREEGREHRSYPDPLTGGAPWTIGVGHTGPEVVPGLVWSDEQIDRVLAADIEAKLREVRNAIPWIDTLSEPRQAVLLQMAFQMGTAGLLGFRNTLQYVRTGQWKRAADGMRASLWARQTPNRARRLSQQMETGEWV